MEVHPHAEHEQDDADLRELLREADIADKPRRVRPDHHAREQVADDRREPQPVRDQPEHPRGRERGGDGGEQRQTLHPRCE
jgi:hypothetical protein